MEKSETFNQLTPTYLSHQDPMNCLQMGDPGVHSLSFHETKGTKPMPKGLVGVLSLR